jgi:inner membrane protein
VFKGLDADGTLAAWRRLLLAVVIANVADLDMIPGIVVGEPNRYHHVGFSHSVVFAVAAALAAGALAAAVGKRWPVVSRRMSAVAGTALMVGLLLLSHVVLDALNRDLRPPAGVPMWWPFSTGYVQLYPWFVDVAKLGGKRSPLDFVASLLVVHNLYAMLWEFLTLAPIVALVAWWRARRPGNGSDLDEAVGS